MVFQWTSVHESIHIHFQQFLFSKSWTIFWFWSKHLKVKHHVLLWLWSSRNQSSPATLVVRAMMCLKIEGQAININTTKALQHIFMIVSNHYFLYSPEGVCDSWAKANCRMLRCLRIQTGNLDLSCDLNQTTELNIPVSGLAWLGLQNGFGRKAPLKYSVYWSATHPPRSISHLTLPREIFLINPAHTHISLLSSPYSTFIRT